MPLDFSHQFVEHYHRALPIFEQLAATRRSIPAMYHKAVMTFDGMGTPESTREGLMQLKKVYAEADNSDTDVEYKHLACYQIGQAYEQGIGARQDTQQAVKWWRLAANEVKYDPHLDVSAEHQLVTDAGTKCQILLAHHYAHLPTPDWEQAYQWYREAGQNGSVESMLQVALMEWYGLSPTEDEIERQLTIETFLTEAAQAGNICAMGNLALFSLHGHQQPLAFHWASQVIERVTAHRTLGAAVPAIQALSHNDNTQEALVKSIVMAYFVLAHLHNVGAVATLDKEKAAEFYEVASAIDADLVQALDNLLESDNQLI
ncbi:LRP2-binding protein-like isoform X2 [Paramacrobiotus metropolitanus]|uniref:LRP2-binding protein-like isoform X2 n=1 Tax=Paramacrobiotus metropolitanus TaxID=2943436 RepID=UPI002445E40A|nr:LRP2-binding protein-like isoform X2 [Paramacrobiotus metropolitanus]